MSVDVICRKCGLEVSLSSIRSGTHKCDEGEAIGILRDRIEALEDKIAELRQRFDDLEK